MNKRAKTLFLSILMVGLGLSAATLSLTEDFEKSGLEETDVTQFVIRPLSQLNVPGNQEGSIFSDATISSGDYHTCAVLDNGYVVCWGDNTYGQIGAGLPESATQSSPSQNNMISKFGGPTGWPDWLGRTAVALSSGYYHTCAILDNGSVSCWGKGTNGQLGNGEILSSNVPIPTSSLGANRTAVALSSGGYHTCAILDDGSVSCWGRGAVGQLGNGANLESTTVPTPTSSLGNGRTAVAISSGGYHTCVILDDGNVKCWGTGRDGQLGTGRPEYIINNVPITTSSLGTGRTAVALSSGGFHTCAILDDGSVSCWGRGVNGQLGNGVNFPMLSAGPTPTSSLGGIVTGRTAVALSSGGYHTCAILDDGSVSCWGKGTNGQLGNGGNSQQAGPTLTDNTFGTGLTPVALSSGYYHTCAILDDGSASCWGKGSSGQLGNGQTSISRAPSPVDLAAHALSIALSERDFDGDRTLNIFDAHTLVDYRESTITTGQDHTCAILDDGSVSCWGRGAMGQLGNGQTSDRWVPSATQSLGTGRTAVALSSGEYHTCAILDNSSVSCWGDGTDGQLGNGATSRQDRPSLTNTLGNGRTAVALSSGDHHTCAILDDGSVSCWGRGTSGQLGNGGILSTNVPTPTQSLGANRTAVALSSGGYHTCAILDDGSVSCWGKGTDGQLGNGTFVNSRVPTPTSSLGANRTAVALSSGGYHTCAILNNGSVSCWGQGTSGQLGNGGFLSTNVPTLTNHTFGLQTPVALSSGDYHTCAILDDGTASCWGLGNHGQLGDATTTNNSVPIPVRLPQIPHRPTVALSSGGLHTCAILDDGRIFCWGRGSYGQLGNNLTSDSSSPTTTLATQSPAMLTIGDVDGDGMLDNLDAYPGNPIRSTICDAGKFGRYVCDDAPIGKFVPSSGSMYATDASPGHYVNQTGQSTQTACLAGTYNPFKASTSVTNCRDANPGHYVNSAGSSSQTACSAGTYQPSSGGSSCGNASAGHFTSDYKYAALSVSAGGNHTCSVHEDAGKLYCWGDNSHGQLGDGTYNDSTTPVAVSLPPGRVASSVSAGGNHTCAILNVDGSDDVPLYCWGNNSYGQLGDGTNNDSNTPVAVVNGTGQLSGQFTGRSVSSVSSGHEFTCAIASSTSRPDLFCWGSNSDGQLGAGVVDANSSTTPVHVSLPTGMGNSNSGIPTSVSSGGYHACAVRNHQVGVDVYIDLYCWGNNSYGQLGNQNNVPDDMAQVALPTGLTPLQVKTGKYHTCAVLDVPSPSIKTPLYCWGNNSYGQLGDGTNTNTNAPVEVSGMGPAGNLTGTEMFSAGSYHTCAVIKASTTIAPYCWGDNSHGQLGDGTNNDSNTPSLQLSIYKGQVSSGGSHVCTVLASERPLCWGSNSDGQLGDGTNNDSNVPVQSHLIVSGAVNQTTCMTGTYNPNTGSAISSACIDASLGHYVNSSGSSSQTACQNGTYNPNTGANNSSACINASPGHYVNQTGQSTQTACAIGTYQSNNGQLSCVDADPGHYVDQTGQDAQIPCEIGSFQPNPGQTGCLDAGRGHYVLRTGQSAQTACDKGTYNTNTGASDPSACIDASPGHYVNSSGSHNQTPCQNGTYQSNNGQWSCDDADPGHYVDQTGQDAQIPCEIGSFQPNPGQISCLDADEGHYVPSIRQSTQTPCDRGTYQAATGESSCVYADEGHYVNQTGQSTQTACAIGTYQSINGQWGCDDADPGHIVSQTGQANQTACRMGTYQAATGQSSCELAGIGYYVDQTGQSSQTQCPSGTSTSLPGAYLENHCLADYDGDNLVDELDTDDDDDGILDADDMCPRGMTGWSSGNDTDFDSDGCSDLIEDYDDDNDGFEDGMDICPWLHGNSTYAFEEGCPDSDGDGRPDMKDPFPEDATEWEDSDGDGVGNNSDVFPNDSTQTLDTDGDGFGDYLFGNSPDGCPDEFGTSVIDYFGCVDSDGDGVSDINDGFPNDPGLWQDSDGDGVEDGADAFPYSPTQWSDVDGDGYGDNPGAASADKFVNDETQWSDVDGDGYGDNMSGNMPDAFPLDPSQWMDSDGDGYGDNMSGNMPDACPDEFGTSVIDYFGCVDSDGDGNADNMSGNMSDGSGDITTSPAISVLIIITVIALMIMYQRQGIASREERVSNEPTTEEE